MMLLFLAVMPLKVASFSTTTGSRISVTRLNYSSDYSPYNPYRGFYNQNHYYKNSAAQPLDLTNEDVQRLQDCYDECGLEEKEDNKIIPLILLDALLPNQRLFFSSADPKFEQLLRYLQTLPRPAQVGILGFAGDGSVLSTGVIATLCLNSVNYGSKYGQPVIATSFKASPQLFEIFHEPAMDPTDSFYLAHVETLSLRDTGEVSSYAQPPHQHYQMAQQLFASIPELVQEWKYWMLRTGWANEQTLERHYQWKEVYVSTHQLLQQTMSERAVWVAANLNPVGMKPLLQTDGNPTSEHGDPYVVNAVRRRSTTPAPDIRHEILECRNDYKRLVMAVSALKQSIEFLKRCDVRGGSGGER
jgi:hypothetical protein